MSWSWEIFYGLITAATLLYTAARRDMARGAAVFFMSCAWLFEGAVYYSRPPIAGNFNAFITECTLLTVLACFPVVRRSVWGRIVLTCLAAEIAIHVGYRTGHIGDGEYHIMLNVLYVVRMITPCII